MTFYRDLTLRNAGYVDHRLQEEIRNCRVLIAGCGIGSTIAEAAARIGFERFTLADADRVERHNLNRQAYCDADVGDLKTAALARRLRSINPEVRIATIPTSIGSDNAAEIVADSDLVFDTIDFLDLSGIVSLHDAANRQGRRLISAMSAGWGAALMYFPPHPGEPSLFRRIFGLPQSGEVENGSYVERFAALFQALGSCLSPEIVAAMAAALRVMEDGAPCPAPHVSPGSYSVAALAVACAVRLLGGGQVIPAPDLIVIDLLRELEMPGIRVMEPGI